jgi:hypothetical protein
MGLEILNDAEVGYAQLGVCLPAWWAPLNSLP